MGWGAMMGLGQGLQQVGGMMMDNYKTKLAAKLEADRQAAADARADFLHNRDQLSFDHDKIEMKDLGGEHALYRVKYNKAGNAYDSTLASQSDIDEYNTNKAKDDAALKAAMLSNQKAEFEVQNAPQEAADKHRVSVATADWYGNRGEAAITNANRPRGGIAGSMDKKPSPMQAAKVLMDSYGSLIKSYTEGDHPIMSMAQVQNIAEKAVATAGERGQDSAKLFTDMMARIAAKYPNPTKPIAPYTTIEMPKPPVP